MFNKFSLEMESKLLRGSQTFSRAIVCLQMRVNSSTGFTPKYSVMHKWSPESNF